MFNRLNKLEIITGKGGVGSLHYFIKNKKKVYTGGNGGNAGNIFIICDKNISYFKYNFLKKITTKNGKNGGKYKCKGKNSKNIIIRLPLNTTIFDLDKNIVLNKLIFHKQIFLLAKGGLGGTSYFYKKKNKIKLKINPTNGVKKKIQLIFNFSSYISLIGMPNTGKSTFLNKLTNSKYKTNNYIFTTLNPNISIYNKKFIIIDIPGILKDSFYGVGLGLSFLTFIEETKILFHFVDFSLINYDILLLINNIKYISNEIYKYKKKLFYKTRYILFNKLDLIKKNTKKNIIKKILMHFNWYNQIFLISSLKKESFFFILKFFKN